MPFLCSELSSSASDAGRLEGQGDGKIRAVGLFVFGSQCRPACPAWVALGRLLHFSICL